MMRLQFLVHTYINMYVQDPETKGELVGYKMKEKTDHTKQTHLLTIDKLVMSMPVAKSFDTEQTAFSNAEQDVIK